MNFITPLSIFPPLTLLFPPFPCASYEKKKNKFWNPGRRQRENETSCVTRQHLNCKKIWIICRFQHTSFLCSSLTDTKYIHENLHSPFYFVPSYFSTLITCSRSFLDLRTCITETALDCSETLILTQPKSNTSLSSIISSANVRT